MLRYFPEPYDDELLYSVIARYFVHSHSANIKLSLKALFSSENVAAVVDFPSHLNELSYNLRALNLPSPLQWLDRHTLFPYWQPFLSQNVRQKVRTAMLGEAGHTIHTRIGSVASLVKTPIYLKYCPLCNAESMDSYGEYYWRCSHQLTLPGYCIKHGTKLVDSAALYTPMAKFCFEAASSTNCKSTTLVRSVARNTCLEALLTEIGRNRFGGEAQFDIARYYQAVLTEKSLVKGDSKYDVEKIVELSKEHLKRYCAVFAMVDESKLASWIGKLNTEKVYSLHPVIHLLVLSALNEYESISRIANPFGAGPWPCFNPLCDRFHSASISTYSSHIDRKSQKTIGVFCCEQCGYAYTQSVNSDGVIRPTSVVDFGFLWKKQLKRLLGADYSLRGCARKLHVDPKTVADQARKLRVKIHWRTGYKKRKAYRPTQRQNRMAWLALRDKYPNYSKSALRAINAALFIRLYRHDRDWLNTNSPPSPSLSLRNNKRVDWRKRDSKVCRELPAVKSRLVERDDYPIRITKTRLIKNTGNPSWLEKKRDKLPKSRQLLDSLAETNDQYLIRKLRWLFAKEKLHLIDLKAWQIQRKIGIRKITPHILRLINTELHQALDEYEIIPTVNRRK